MHWRENRVRIELPDGRGVVFERSEELYETIPMQPTSAAPYVLRFIAASAVNMSRAEVRALIAGMTEILDNDKE